ncbi:hypothetical protein COT29_01995 [Candidatus Micrarchaeota archaeon CG08_land_8_20_14_0_20_59_11]|nr:MAG: hypothetical protein COT29_01995 [Candidatus Micrarchaeota archaeon CG08_land_8_20_14_0_20_59_11]
MRFFRHGDVLAIAIPESLRKTAGVQDGDDYEFFEIQKGVFALVGKKELASKFPAGALAAQATAAPNPQLAALEKTGFLVVETELEAKRLSKELEPQVKGHSVMGVRGFDKKYYIATRTFLAEAGEKVQKALLKGEMTLGQACVATKMPQDACVAALSILKEEGEIFEKRKGYYALVR